MHFPSLPRPETALFLALLLAPLPTSGMLQCDHIRVGDVDFNLSKLGGPHSVVTSKWHPPTYTNTSYTIDICKPLKRKGDVKKGDECPNGTRVCAIERLIRPDEDSHDDIQKVIPIAGELKDHGGGTLDPKVERLKSSDSHSDHDKEGLRLVLQGGRYPLEGKHKRPQKAIIEFICHREKTGLEGEITPEDQYSAEALRTRAEDKDEGDDGDDGEERQNLTPGAALVWKSYGPSEKGDVDVLRLTWYTQYACEDAWANPPDSGDEDSSRGWGFFTWFVILAFLGIAAYLIFGSWLNYNRYGARGWDLLPHGDTIRDIPYILKDLARSVLNAVQGSGTRGGYSAL
ncbi:hypothetical protein SODALDRAFT_329385 [Sodiomyces alkalinus F11]|uniref:Autophagy-related protein 27 n=1 Tax=Sodiomyces alkalinus (strain CBS 110278 / VKM F-3762 / F11) TaxID=1314773 RepID=A0A3N2PLB9_SODAK|nr:hypothetical protein SODALDRAFT_329385 [Sodiomyces alkalinus F11]ROT35200.1 hypothetical protein SODALDRAFT_329385 [Sodiomyces alkalinus F11]